MDHRSGRLRQSRLTLGSAPWRRAPRLLLRHPGVFGAAVLASAVLALAASSGSLFVASVGTAALHDEAAQSCPEAALPAISDASTPSYASVTAFKATQAARAPARLPANDHAVRAAVAGRGLPDPFLVAISSTTGPLGPTDSLTLFARAGALDHVHTLTPRGRPGVWLPASYAASAGARAGSTIRMGGTALPVAGVYRDIAPSAFDPEYRLPRYWCTWSEAIVPDLMNRPPPLVITDLATMRAVPAPIEATWFVPQHVAHTTLPQLRAAIADTDAALGALRGVSPLAFHTLGDASSLVDLAARERDGVAGSIVPIDVAGVVVAALLVCLAGVFWSVRRRRELRLLNSRGVSRAALGVKAALEAGPALMLGAAGGLALSFGLIDWEGPSAILAPGGRTHAAAAAAASLVGAVLLIAVVGALASPGGRSRGSRSWLVRTPWELLLVAASLLTYLDIRAHGGVVLGGGTVHVRPAVLAFPLLAVPGALVLAARCLRVASARLGRRAHRLPDAGYLAAKRIASNSIIAACSVIGIALPISVLVYSYALSGSTSSDVPRKYQTNIGADYALGTLARPGSTPAVDGAGTVVSVIDASPGIGGQKTAVLGVDPETFTRFAFPVVPVRALTERLSSSAGRLDAVLVNAPSGLHPHEVAVGTARIRVHVVARTAVFPGLRNGYQPMLVVNRAALPPLPFDTDRTEEIWTSRPLVGRALDALRRQHIDLSYDINPTTFLQSTRLRPITWILGYLRAMAYLVGLVALSGLVFIFTARTRRTALSYHLACRMGLTRRRHRRALLAELTLVLGTSWFFGVGVAMLGVLVVYRLADPYPDSPPPPALPLPMSAAGVAAACCAALAVLGAVSLQALLDRVRPTDLLRAG